MYIRHKLSNWDLRWLSLLETCEKVTGLSTKYDLLLKFDWDGDDDLITIYVKPNSDPFELEEEYYRNLKYSRLSPLGKFLVKDNNSNVS